VKVRLGILPDQLARPCGVDPSEFARHAGHASVAFTYDRYGNPFPEIDEEAADTWNEYGLSQEAH
jgi:hypothetical protein